MTTAIEAVNFAKDLVNQGQGVDFDGYYGTQCVDLPNWICGKFFGKALWGNAIDLLNSAEQHGFDVHRMPTSERPRAGALFVKSYVAGDGIDYGHTGIIIDVDGDTVQTVEQNLVGDLSVGGPAQYASQRIDNLVGWFYPPYADSGQSEPDQMMEKTDEELAQEVIAGLHGFGEERKHSLGPRYDAVQTKVNEILNGSLSAAEELKEEPQTVQIKEDGDLSFNGAILKKSVLDIILRKCQEHNILPSYAITCLHFEGLWGT